MEDDAALTGSESRLASIKHAHYCRNRRAKDIRIQYPTPEAIARELQSKVHCAV